MSKTQNQVLAAVPLTSEGKALTVPKSFIGTFAQKGKPLSIPDKVAAVFSHQFPGVGPDETIKASMVRLSNEGANAAMGGKATPESFIEGLVYKLALHAGGKTLDRLQIGLTPIAQSVLVRAALPLKMGTPLSLGQAQETIVAAIEWALSLPVYQKPVPVSDTGSNGTSSSTDEDTPVRDTASDAKTMSDAIRAVADASTVDMRNAVPHDMSADEQEASIEALEHATAAACAAAVARAEAVAIAAQEAFERKVAQQLRDHEAKSVAFCRLANELGIKLTKAQLAQLTKHEAIAVAA
jgi:hypothetical protein